MKPPVLCHQRRGFTLCQTIQRPLGVKHTEALSGNIITFMVDQMPSWPSSSCFLRYPCRIQTSPLMNYLNKVNASLHVEELQTQLLSFLRRRWREPDALLAKPSVHTTVFTFGVMLIHYSLTSLTVYTSDYTACSDDGLFSCFSSSEKGPKYLSK